MKKRSIHPIVTGTIILTLTGLVSRLIGFFYRIYLARLFGEEGMGIYQLISPVLSLSFSLTAAGYQTAISKLVAENTARQNSRTLRPLFAALSISLPLSLLCNLVVFSFSEEIAVRLLLEQRTASMLRILSFSIPFAAVHACINGYFYGIKKTGVPAATQLIEQCVRVGCVFFLSSKALASGAQLTINVAVLGLTVGEICSMAVAVVAMYATVLRERHPKPLSAAASLLHTAPNQALTGRVYHPSSSGRISNSSSGRGSNPLFSGRLYGPLLSMVLPLTANRIVLNLLQSLESVSIPAKLRLYGYDTATALSVYGVLTGMAMPLIFFPNALTSSISVLLLPMISEAHALGDMQKVKKYTLQTVKFCILLGFVCMSVFLLSGKWVGSHLFHSELAGHFIVTLSFLCPFLYLDTTLSSILQGLGMAGHIFVMNVISLLIRLGFVFYAVPLFGITGYLWGILASQILLSILYFLCLFLGRSKMRHA